MRGLCAVGTGKDAGADAGAVRGCECGAWVSDTHHYGVERPTEPKLWQEEDSVLVASTMTNFRRSSESGF